MLLSYLSEYFGDHLTDILSPLWDVWVEVIQVLAEAQRDDLEVIWKHDRENESLSQRKKAEDDPVHTTESTDVL